MPKDHLLKRVKFTSYALTSNTPARLHSIVITSYHTPKFICGFRGLKILVGTYVIKQKAKARTNNNKGKTVVLIMFKKN